MFPVLMFVGMCFLFSGSVDLVMNIILVVMGMVFVMVRCLIVLVI